MISTECFRALAILAVSGGIPALAGETGGSALEERSMPSATDSITVMGQREGGELELDSVSAIGSRLGLAVRDLPASVSVVTQDSIQLHGARTALEVIEAAVGMAGGTAVGSIPNYATRGFAGGDITIMRDGIRQNTTAQSSRPLDAFLFDRVEVLKGPASLLYGEGAIGGAVNYVSKAPDKTLRGETLSSAGAWDSYRVAVGLGGPTGIENLYFRADASHSSGNGYVERSAYQYDALATSLAWELSPQTRLSFSGTYLEDDVESYYGTPVVYDAVIGPNGEQSVRRANAAADRLVNPRVAPGTRRLNYNNRDNFARAENSFWRVVLDTSLTDSVSLRNEIYAATQHFNWRNTESAVWNPATQLVERGSFLLIYRNDFQWGNRFDVMWMSTVAGRPNKLLLGALHDDNDQIRNTGQNNYATSPVTATVPLLGFDPGVGPAAQNQKTVGVVTQTNAIYLEDVFEPVSNWQVIGGLRYDVIEVARRSFLDAAPFAKEYRPLTGRLGAIYSITPALNVYASYSWAAQPVSQLVGLTSSHADFSLQKGRQLEAGVKTTFWRSRADLTVALFDIGKTDLLTSTLIDGVRVNSQIGAQVSQGAELALALNPAEGWRLDWNVAWTWTAEFEDFSENLGAGVISRNGNTPPNIPEWVAGLFVTKEIGAWSVAGGARHVSERQANNNNGIQLAAYTTVDASVSYQWGDLRATLRGRNLTNETYAEWASGNGLMMRLADPRSAEISLKYAF